MAALKEQGDEVSLGLVSVIKYSKGSKRGNLGTTTDALLLTKKLVECDRIRQRTHGIDVLEKLR